MKKVLFCAAAVCLLGLSSCRTTFHTATEVHSGNALSTTTVANLEVGSRVTYTYTPTNDVRKGGLKNVKAAAISALLKANGNADVIVAPEFKYDSDLSQMEVSGRPAKYTNFKSVN